MIVILLLTVMRLRGQEIKKLVEAKRAEYGVGDQAARDAATAEKEAAEKEAEEDDNYYVVVCDGKQWVTNKKYIKRLKKASRGPKLGQHKWLWQTSWANMNAHVAQAGPT